ETLNKSNLEIIGCQFRLESLEARIVFHEKNEAVFEEDKTGLSYDGQVNECDLNDLHVNESEVLNNVVDSRDSDVDDNEVIDRLDNFVFKSKVSETITSVPKIKTNASKTSQDSLEKPKTVRSSAPLIEEWESDSKDENVFKPKEVKKTVKPSLKKIEFVNAGNTLPVNAAKQISHKAATSVSVASRVYTAASRLNVNNTLPTTYSYFKAHSPVRRPFNQKLTAKTNNFNEKVNTAKVNNVPTAGTKAVVSVVKGNRNNIVKSSSCWIWRPKGNLIDHIFKDSESYTLKRFNYFDPQGRLKSVMAWVPMRN
nr:hypothetical protein [Tanacetum cinerariifolium]